METQKRTTIYFDADIHHALRIRAAAAHRSVSEMVNEAVKTALAEDALDFEAIAKRKRETGLSFESLVRDLRRRGRI